jgi:hypothetical protein
MAMAAMDMMSKGGFRGVSFHLQQSPQGIACVLLKETPTFGLDHLTVYELPRKMDCYSIKIFIMAS